MNSKTLLIFMLLQACAMACFAQKPDSTTIVSSLSGSAAITNNGISVVPTFSLGKPAAVFNMWLKKNGFSLDPELAYSTDGHPWYFTVWLRYKIANTTKFKLATVAQMALNFKQSVLKYGGDSVVTNTVERYVACEVAPNYFITKNTSVGLYYLLAHGLDAGTSKAVQFFSLNANFLHIKLGPEYYIKFAPQLYYLNIDGDNGFYFTQSLTLAKEAFPLSVSSVINKPIKTTISAGNGFTWNVSLTYALPYK